MKFFLEKLGLVRATPDEVVEERHMAPWHPLFKKAVTFHILETTATRSSHQR